MIFGGGEICTLVHKSLLMGGHVQKNRKREEQVHRNTQMASNYSQDDKPKNINLRWELQKKDIFVM